MKLISFPLSLSKPNQIEPRETPLTLQRYPKECKIRIVVIVVLLSKVVVDSTSGLILSHLSAKSIYNILAHVGDKSIQPLIKQHIKTL